MAELKLSHLTLPCKDGITIVVFGSGPTQSCLQRTFGFWWPLLRVWDTWACPEFLVARWHHLARRAEVRVASSPGIGCSADIATQDGKTVRRIFSKSTCSFATRFTVDNTSTQVIVIRFGILNFSKECERKPSRRRWFIKFANNIRGMAPSRGNAEPWVSLKIWVHRDPLVCHRQLDLIVLSMSLGQNSLIDNRFCYQKYAVYDFWFNCCFWMIYSLLSNQHGLETILKSSPQDESPRCFGFTRQSGDIHIDYKPQIIQLITNQLCQLYPIIGCLSPPLLEWNSNCKWFRKNTNRLTCDRSNSNHPKFLGKSLTPHFSR